MFVAMEKGRKGAREIETETKRKEDATPHVRNWNNGRLLLLWLRMYERERERERERDSNSQRNEEEQEPYGTVPCPLPLRFCSPYYPS